MRLGEQIQALMSAVPPARVGDPEAVLARAARRARRRRLTLGAGCAAMAVGAVAIVTGVASDIGESRAPVIGDSPDSERSRDCSSLADDIADLVVDVAEHAGTSHPGQLPAAVDGPWLLAAAAAQGDDELEERVDRRRAEADRLGCEPGFAQESVERRVDTETDERASDASDDPEQYTTVNVMSLLAGHFGTVDTYDVPDGFPEEFPLPETAQLVEHEHDGETASASWLIKRRDDGQSVYAFYRKNLQQADKGETGWSIIEAQGEEEFGDQYATQESFMIVGHGYEGELSLSPAEQGTLVQATLRPQE